MSFVFYPNHERRCPDLMHCPHIGGAALGYVVSLANENDERRDWLFRQLDATREESAAKSRRIAELEERVKQLEAELKAERQKQFKAAKPEEEQASAVVPGENQAKKSRRPRRSPGMVSSDADRDRSHGCGAPASNLSALWRRRFGAAGSSALRTHPRGSGRWAAYGHLLSPRGSALHEPAVRPMGTPARRRRDPEGEDRPADARAGPFLAVPHRLAVSQGGGGD